MAAPEEPLPGAHFRDRTGEHFTHTQWSMVLRAGDAGSADSQQALERLCRTYWPPIYGYLRRKGFSAADAEDHTQEFFAALLRRGSIAAADATRGRFRTFLLSSLQNFLRDARDKATAAKRGGGHAVMALDCAEAERRYLEAPSGELNPEQLFDRRWAAALLEAAVARMAEEHAAARKLAIFTRLRPFLTEQPTSGDYESASVELGMKPNTIAATVRRLRLRCRELLREELGQTAAGPDDAEQEFRTLFG